MLSTILLTTAWYNSSRFWLRPCSPEEIRESAETEGRQGRRGCISQSHLGLAMRSIQYPQLNIWSQKDTEQELGVSRQYEVFSGSVERIRGNSRHRPSLSRGEVGEGERHRNNVALSISCRRRHPPHSPRTQSSASELFSHGRSSTNRLSSPSEKTWYVFPRTALLTSTRGLKTPFLYSALMFMVGIISGKA